jgi:predicted nucleic acid-binding protein
MRLYLDSNAIVFAVEGPESLRSFVAEWTSRAEEAGGNVLTSRLSIPECLARPLRDRDSVRILSLKTIDALHVASAIRAGANVFLTRDTGINRYKNLRGVTCEAIPSEG